MSSQEGSIGVVTHIYMSSQEGSIGVVTHIHVYMSSQEGSIGVVAHIHVYMSSQEGSIGVVTHSVYCTGPTTLSRYGQSRESFGWDSFLSCTLFR